MTWLTPSAFWLLAALPVLAAIFLYRRRVLVVDVPAITPWLALGKPVEISSFRSLLRRLLSLALQTAIVSLLILAAAGPTRHLATGTCVIVLDTSATMGFRNAHGVTRFQEAQSLCRQVIDSLPTGCNPHPLPGDGREHALRLRQIQSLETEPVVGDLSEAVRVAQSLLPSSSSESRAVMVVSDFADADVNTLRRKWKDKIALTLVPTGEDAPNAGIIHARSQESPEGRMVIHATIVSHGLAGRSVPVSLVFSGTAIGTQNCTLADQPVTIRFESPAPTSPQAYELRLGLDDGFSLDNHFYLRSAPMTRRVTLVTNGNPPLKALLTSADNTRVTTITPNQAATAESADIVVFDRVQAAGASPRSGEGYLFIGTADPFGWMKVAGSKPIPGPSSWAADHPVLRDVNPALFPSLIAIQADFASAIQTSPLIEWNDIPLLVEAKIPPPGDSRVLYLLCDPFQTSLPGTLSFPILIYNAMDYLGSDKDAASAYLSTGSVLTIPATTNGVVPTLTGPDGKLLPLVASGQALRLPHATQAGIYRVQTPQGVRPIAVNCISTAATRPLPQPRQGDVIPRGDHRMLSALACLLTLSPLGLLAAAFLLAGTEYLLFHRGCLRIG